MGRKNKSTSGSLTVSLLEPGMTVLHKAGLAGLWMTLRALEKSNLLYEFKGLGSWKRDAKSVSITWQDEKFFEVLFKKSFGIKDGLFYFPAFGDPEQKLQHAVVLQEAVLGTLLQHGRTRKADKSDKPTGSLSVEIDGVSIPLKYHRVSSYAHQKPDFSPAGVNKLVGWLYPGAGRRHIAFGVTELENTAAQALALRFLVVGAIYFEIRRRGEGIKPRYALVIPDIDDLERYSRVRSIFVDYGVQYFQAAGSAEAGLRVLVELEAKKVVEDLSSAACRVFSFGTVPWSKQQKTRVEIFEVGGVSGLDLKPFKMARQVFKVKPVSRNDTDIFLDVPQVPELIARNVLDRRPWWYGFADFISDKAVRRHVFGYEKGGLAKMVEDRNVFSGHRERVFVEACHEAWRRRLGQLGQRARREGISFQNLINREFERLRVAFSRSKNASAIRAAVTDFWSRSGGSLVSLRDGWRDVLPLFSDQNWQKARDLALLALASYKPASKEEEEVLNEIVDEEGGE